MQVLDFAYQIIEMQYRIDRLEAENEDLRQYKEKYYELIDGEIKRGDSMMATVFTTLLMKEKEKSNA